jgi:hypothetical protein
LFDFLSETRALHAAAKDVNRRKSNVDLSKQPYNFHAAQGIFDRSTPAPWARTPRIRNADHKSL